MEFIMHPNPLRLFVFLLFSFITFTTSVDLHYHTQPVDHFGYGNMSQQTFRQRVFLDYYYVPGKHIVKGAPILILFGGETNVETMMNGPGNGPAILMMAAKQLGSLVVYIEHRFYGKSIPYGSIESAMDDVEVRGCLTSAQALADFADVILYLKKNLSTIESPVVVMGGSYAGMLAAWFRLKYPHIAVGALASSAPVTSFLELPIESQYCSIVSRDFKETNEACFDRISKSWALIDQVAEQPDGLKVLDRTFKTCSPLDAAYQVKNYLAQILMLVAQYNGRFNRISEVCQTIVSSPNDDILQGISKATFVVNKQVCNNFGWSAQDTVLDADSQRAWDWQTCSELLQAPYACRNDSMFESHQFKLADYMEECRLKYGVDPHPSWMSTYYGGQELKSALKDFGSNIIFSNGLKDPWSGASILQDISESIVAITTTQGSHCLDIIEADDNDPEWLIDQRRSELEIITKWIKTSGGSPMRYSGWFRLVTISMILYYLFFC